MVDNSIITQADRDLLAQAYEEAEHNGGPYPSYAELARKGDGAFTLCSLRAIARARIAGAEQERKEQGNAYFASVARMGAAWKNQ